MVKGNTKKILVIGFALFAMFFGAGNLIFPPYLGFISGGKWGLAIAGFTVADAGFGLLGIIALANFNGDIISLGSKVNKKFAIALSLAIILCIGPFLAMPRTAATSYEIGVIPILGESFSKYLFSTLFFLVSILLTIRPNKVVDIVGKILTPALLISVGFLIIKGLVNPVGPIADNALVDGVLKSGIRDGYQTMDAMASCVFSLVVINEIKALKLSGEKEEFKMTISSGITAALCLALVYGGLAHLGATYSKNMYVPIDIDNTELLVDITNRVLGRTGLYIIAIIVFLACLTTAIGLLSATSSYFTNLFNGRFSYGQIVIVVAIVSGLISVLGVSEIIKISAPILEVIYPCVTTLIIIGLFEKWIKDDLVYKIPVLINLFLGLMAALIERGYLSSLSGIYKALPLEVYGLYWVIPMILGVIVALLISKIKKPASKEA